MKRASARRRLAEELVDWSGLNGVTAVTARCYAGEGRLAYAPIAALAEERRAAAGADEAGSVLDDRRRQASSRAARRRVPRFPHPTGSSRAGSACVSSRRWRRRSGRRLRSSSSSTICNGPTPTRSNGFSISCARHPTCAASSSAPCAPRRSRTIPPLGRLLGHLERDNLLTTIALGPLDRDGHGATGRRSGRASARRDDAGAHVSRNRRSSAVHRRTRTDGAGEAAGLRR